MPTLLKRFAPALLSAAVAAAAVSCTDDDLFADGSRDTVREGVPVTVNLNFRTEDNRVETRAAQNAANEGRVYNLYVLIFDKDGNRHDEGGLFFDQSTEPWNQSGTVTITTTSLNDARVVCIANLTTSAVHTDYDVTPAQMNEIRTFGQLEAFRAPLSNRTVEHSTQFFMTGYGYRKDSDGNPDKTQTSITIPDNLTEEVEVDCILSPRRMDAKVTFNVKTEPLRDTWTDFDFRPRSWRVVNVPVRSPLLPDDDGGDEESPDVGESYYFDTRPTAFEWDKRDENYLFEEGGFTFYMPESRHAPKKSIDAAALGPEDAYALREKCEKIEGTFPDKPGQSEENGAFEYAADYAAYVEMTGTLSYRIPSSEAYPSGHTVNADVTFTVHLGYADGDPNDYRTLRNTHYTYNVTLKGVDKIVVEVTDQKEERPGYEGDVIFSSADVYELDAHYDRQLILIDRSLVPKLTWGVQTPFSQGIYGVGLFGDDDDFLASAVPAPEESGIYDYKWVKFAINEDYGVTEPDRYVKYPGDQNYEFYDGNGGQSSPYYTSGEGGFYPDARMYDIHGLLKRLREEYYTENKTEGTVAVTAFVDEYVYVTHPVTGENMLDQWRTYVEAEDRQMYFVNGDNSRYSPDGNSSVMEAVQTFRQHSIRTVYNTDLGEKSAEELPTAWGVETMMNGGYRWAPGDVGRGTSASNGRKNTIDCLLGGDETLYWTAVLDVNINDPDERYNLKDPYRDALHAVLIRNRDLDGDNEVDANEIRWYLAAKDQLVDLYIGESALDEDSRLYPENPADRGNMTRWHYTSSSYNANDGGPWILWSEECAALGSYSSSSGYMDGQFAYRCVRNLGIDLENPEKEPSPLIPKVTAAEDDGTYLVDCSNLSQKARRNSYEAGPSLGTHDDLSPQNRPYKYFRVTAANNDGISPKPDYSGDRLFGSWNSQNWTYYQTAQTVVQRGYRIPNFRELLIMATRLPEEAWVKRAEDKSDNLVPTNMHLDLYYMTITDFSRKGISELGKGGGFRMNPRDLTLGAIPSRGEDLDDGYIRPVKDEETLP